MTRTYQGIEIPENDEERVEAVLSYNILETPREAAYDDITEIAARVTECPVSYISIFDGTRSWLKSSYGLPADRPPRPRELSMCAPTICQTEMLVIPDLAQNSRYRNLPAVTNPPHAKFYCGVPLINRDGFALGTQCVWSPESIEFDDGRRDAMARLARLTLNMLEGRRDLIAAQEQMAQINGELQRGKDALERAESIAYKLLPASFAARLLVGADVQPKLYNNTLIICFGFEPAEDDAESDLLKQAETLGAYVALLDRIVSDASLGRIGLASEVYFASVGMPRETDDPSAEADKLIENISVGLVNLNADRAARGEPCWRIRYGKAVGPVAATTVGNNRINFCAWGGVARAAHAQLTPGILI